LRFLSGGFVPELEQPADLKPSFTTFNREDAPGSGCAASEFREGLPKTYRPRHDLHYVEQLTAATDTQPVRLVPVSRIDGGDLPPEHTVASLADSIVELGIVQPLLVRPHNGELVQDPRVAVRLSGQSGGGPIALVIAQPSAVLSETALARFFEAGWTERPGGSSAELAILLARQAASLHRARLEVSSVAAAGTAVTMTFEG
jgi:hypothetical protein